MASIKGIQAVIPGDGWPVFNYGHEALLELSQQIYIISLKIEYFKKIVFQLFPKQDQKPTAVMDKKNVFARNKHLQPVI